MTESQIEALEAARREAMLSGDPEALGDLLAEDLTWVHASSNIDDKSSFLRGIGDGYLKCFRLDHLQTNIRIYGPAALVTGVVEMDVAVAGVRRSSTNCYACLWAMIETRPRLVLWQSTRLQPPSS
jgi:Domain of unknown function (DUF4440)